MSYIYLKVNGEQLTFSKLRFSKFKTLVSRSPFGELQPTKILNFKIPCCNLKVRGLGEKRRVAFILF